MFAKEAPGVLFEQSNYWLLRNWAISKLIFFIYTTSRIFYDKLGDIGKRLAPQAKSHPTAGRGGGIKKVVFSIWGWGEWDIIKH